MTGLSRDSLGTLATLLLILLGGMALNLTPCILPMIPINLAIIGAGVQASSRRTGFALGGAYGLGMAMAYGALGVAVVLTGSKFGTLNSSPWFNLAIAMVFIALGISMFDVFTIDLSRFQGRGVGTPNSNHGKFILACGMGAVAALLAGACVAPVVLSVMLQATTLYNDGMVVGLLLPFLLGVGMGLPWPFAGAGLSFLPKPGVWMTRVKHGFGVLILAMAGWYGFTASGQFIATERRLARGGPSLDDQLASALARAREEGKPVLIDFWASWCKNCSAMEHTTLRSPVVRKQLGDYIQVKLQTEHPGQSPAKDILDHFGAIGLPSYILLAPPVRGIASAPAANVTLERSIP